MKKSRVFWSFLALSIIIAALSSINAAASAVLIVGGVVFGIVAVFTVGMTALVWRVKK